MKKYIEILINIIKLVINYFVDALGWYENNVLLYHCNKYSHLKYYNYGSTGS